MPRRLVREVFSMWKWLETSYSILVLNVKCNNNLCISNSLVWLSMSSGVEFRLLLTTQESCSIRDIKSCAPHVNAKIKQITPNYHISQLLSNKHVLHSCFLEAKEPVKNTTNNKNTCIPFTGQTPPTLRRFEIHPQDSNPRYLVSLPILDGRTSVLRQNHQTCLSVPASEESSPI